MDDLKLIKKYYGEKMSHLCRELFPTILETPGLLFKLLDSTFAHSKFLYEDIIEQNSTTKFKDFIYGLINEDNKITTTDKNPFELMKEAGYTLYECKSEEDIQKFKHYYSDGEELCTFNGGRLKSSYVFFAVKDNIEKIKREDFVKPKRQDEYGTSVVSIQFTKGSLNTLSIKNRYNHTVNQCDATFSNNLENIIKGLTDSFTKYYNLNISQQDGVLNLDNYVIANDKKYYRYNYEICNIYYCTNNVIIDNYRNVETKYLDNSERYILIDYFVLDLKEKKLFFPDTTLPDDSFVNLYNSFDSIKIVKENNYKYIIFSIANCEDIIIKIDKYNRMIEFTDNNVSIIDNNFLIYNRYLESISLGNVRIINDSFLEENKYLKLINIPNVVNIGNYFLIHNDALENIEAQNLLTIGNKFLLYNHKLTNIKLPKVYEIGNEFLSSNTNLSQISLPNLIKCKNDFIMCNQFISKVEFNSLIEVGNNFLKGNRQLISASFPKLSIIGENFLEENEILSSINIQNALKIDNNFLINNKKLKELHLPLVVEIKTNFLVNNIILKNIIAPSLVTIKHNFLYFNEEIKNLDLPSLLSVGDNFLRNNRKLSMINVKLLEKTGDRFLFSNEALTSIVFPNLKDASTYFLHKNELINYLSLNNLEIIRTGFMRNNKMLISLNLPNVTSCNYNIDFFPFNLKLEQIYMPKLGMAEQILNDKKRKILIKK